LKKKPIEHEPIEGPVVCMACVECVDCKEYPEMAKLCPITCIKYKRPNPKPYTLPPFN